MRFTFRLCAKGYEFSRLISGWIILSYHSCTQIAGNYYWSRYQKLLK